MNSREVVRSYEQDSVLLLSRLAPGSKSTSMVWSIAACRATTRN